MDEPTQHSNPEKNRFRTQVYQRYGSYLQLDAIFSHLQKLPRHWGIPASLHPTVWLSLNFS